MYWLIIWLTGSDRRGLVCGVRCIARSFVADSSLYSARVLSSDELFRLSFCLCLDRVFFLYVGWDIPLELTKFKWILWIALTTVAAIHKHIIKPQPPRFWSTLHNIIILYSILVAESPNYYLVRAMSRVRCRASIVLPPGVLCSSESHSWSGTAAESAT